MKTDSLFAGLMTGTSLDGVDAVLAEVGADRVRLLHHHSQPIPAALRVQLSRLCLPGDNEIERQGIAHRALGHCYGDAIKTLLAGSGVDPEAVTAIGCHGQTVRHRPGPSGFSLQLGCADTLACATDLPVVHDFRNKDMVLGGQGAPLTPRFHQFAFGKQGQRTAVLNLGGIANISLLDGRRLIRGFDTGPANTLLDGWYHQHHDGEYDSEGQWAGTGKVLPDLLDTLLADPYFRKAPPKSTGREHFHQNWLAASMTPGLQPQDVQATLAELTAHSVAEAIAEFRPQRLLVCGGGVHNRDLMARLARLSGVTPQSTATAGLSPQWVEACAFAWLAWAFWNRVPGNAPIVTGAARHAILGHLALPT